MRAFRARRAVAAAIALVGLVAVGLPAGGVEGTLPGGTTIAVDITAPAAGEVVPYGAPVPITGTASIGATAPTAPNTVLIYDLDVSGSTTTAGTPATVAACGNQNVSEDTLSGTTLDCEIKSLINVNQSAIARGTIRDAGVVALGGSTSSGPNINDSRQGDVSPVGGVQLLASPSADVNNGGGPDVEEVLHSAFIPGLRQFTSVAAPNSSTNYEQSVIVATSSARTSAATNRIVVLVSDGEATMGSSGHDGLPAGGSFSNETQFKAWVQSIAVGTTGRPVKFLTFAVGSAGQCQPPSSGWNQYGTLKAIAEATGGTCQVVSDPAVLPTVVPAVVDARLTGLTVTVDGLGVPATLSQAPPVTGPASLTWSASAAGLLPGTHEICARVTGTDSGGPGGVQDCRTIEVKAVTIDGPFGGSAGDLEGSPVAISANVNGTATFAGWTYAPGASVDPGATCAFDDPTASGHDRSLHRRRGL